MKRITRANQQVDVIYEVLDDNDGESYFVTPDGEGRYWYETLDEATEQHGDNLPVVQCTVDPFEV